MNEEIGTNAQILNRKPVAAPTNALANTSIRAIVNFNSDEDAGDVQPSFARFGRCNKTASLTFREQRFIKP